MKRYVRSSSNPEADAYFEIMNLLDDVALRGSRLTANEKLIINQRHKPQIPVLFSVSSYLLIAEPFQKI